MATTEMNCLASGGGGQNLNGKISISSSSYVTISVPFTPKYFCAVYDHVSTGTLFLEKFAGDSFYYMTYTYPSSTLHPREVENYDDIVFDGNTVKIKCNNSSWGTGYAYYHITDDATQFDGFLT